MTPDARRSLLRAAALGLALSWASVSGAATFVFTKVVDTSTPVPGGIGTFTGFNPPSLDGNRVSFRGTGSSPLQGIYTWRGGTLRLVADPETPIPGGTGTFSQLDPDTDVSGDNVAFQATGFNQDGIYLDDGIALQKLADLNSAIPAGVGNFIIFDFVSIDGSTVAFRATGPDAGSGLQHGVYSNVDGVLHRVVDRSTPIPGGIGDFTGLFSRPSFDDGEVVFEGHGSSGQTGIYTAPVLGGPAVRVADRSTPIPGGFGSFTSFSEPAIGDGTVVFPGEGASGQTGVYRDVGGTISVVADQDTVIPGETREFRRFDEVSASGGNVAFRGDDGTGESGIYIDLQGTLIRVIGPGDTLDGMDPGLAFWRHGLSGDSLVFKAGFPNGSSAIYLATLASPARPTMAPPEVFLVDVDAEAPATAWSITLESGTAGPAPTLTFAFGGRVGSSDSANTIKMSFDTPVANTSVIDQGDWSFSAPFPGEDPRDLFLDITGLANTEIVAPALLRLEFETAPTGATFQCCFGDGDVVQAQLVPEPSAVLALPAALIAVAALTTGRRSPRGRLRA